LDAQYVNDEAGTPPTAPVLRIAMIGISARKALIEAANGGGAVVGPFAIGICVMDVKTKARA
jgi:hypothetical protein